MGWPQWTIVGILALNVLVNFELDGQPRDPWSFSSSVLSAAALALILQAGGFWK